ncbi:hypothetical protein DL89DRAFT_181505 [Linderina pennispora]|uniref:Uncharacterized protein n=1 Tax=Linderina pennispora TaxID=61395 RepID=A0A1Y1W5I6_9FUNG|nr:uncharacterized protein DL89DRAFT_181505 [Linderina pennispora]ORX68662.1 hypothetical protein DL89DRAFT_181505 [Linderina pennispora]
MVVPIAGACGCLHCHCVATRRPRVGWDPRNRTVRVLHAANPESEQRIRRNFEPRARREKYAQLAKQRHKRPANDVHVRVGRAAVLGKVLNLLPVAVVGLEVVSWRVIHVNRHLALGVRVADRLVEQRNCRLRVSHRLVGRVNQ